MNNLQGQAALAEQGAVVPAWAPVVRMRTHEQVLDEVERQIIDGNLRQGDRLPSERDFAQMLGVSRPSVREALRVLEAMGVVAARAGSGPDAGCTIAGQANDALTRMLRIYLSLKFFDPGNVTMVRSALEASAARAAAEKTTPADAKRLRGVIARMRNAKTPDEALERDVEFHLAIADISGNPLLVTLMAALRASIRRVIDKALDDDAFFSIINNACDEHVVVVEALERHDADAAETAIGGHIASFFAEHVRGPAKAGTH